MFTSPFPDFTAFALLEAEALERLQAHPEELATLSERAVAKRRRDFTLGRLAARQALEALGEAAVPVMPGSDRAPIWPAGIVGAITHTAGIAASVVAHGAETQGLGLDIEDIAGLKNIGIARMIADDDEQAWIDGDRARLISLFSAKEAVFKAFYRLRGEYFGFEAVHLEWSGAGFDCELIEALGAGWPPGTHLPVQVAREGTLVMSSVVLPGPARV